MNSKVVLWSRRGVSAQSLLPVDVLKTLLLLSMRLLKSPISPPVLAVDPDFMVTVSSCRLHLTADRMTLWNPSALLVFLRLIPPALGPELRRTSMWSRLLLLNY